MTAYSACARNVICLVRLYNIIVFDYDRAYVSRSFSGYAENAARFVFAFYNRVVASFYGAVKRAIGYIDSVAYTDTADQSAGYLPRYRYAVYFDPVES